MNGTVKLSLFAGFLFLSAGCFSDVGDVYYCNIKQASETAMEHSQPITFNDNAFTFKRNESNIFFGSKGVLSNREYPSTDSINDNTEFFIVGKNFLTIPKQISIELLYIIDNYDTIDADTLDLFQDTYPESFVQQLSYINKILVDKHNFVIDKQLYYFDNYEHLDKKFTELAPKFIKEKNIEWLRRYKIKK